MSKIFGRFCCKHCGDRCDLSADEMSDYEDGCYMNDPNCCDDCYEINSDFQYPDYPNYSDADSGL